MNLDLPLQDCLRQLNDPDPSKRREAIENLGTRREPSCINALVEHLGDTNRGVQQAVVDALIETNDKETVAAIVLKLDNDSASIRNLALEVLQKVTCQVVDVLIPYLKHSSNDLRKAVTDILGDAGDQSATPYLIEAINDVDPNVRTAAIEALGKLRDPKAVHVLTQSLKDKEVFIRFAAAEAIGQICDEDTVKLLLNNLSPSDEVTAFSIVEALGELKVKEAVEPLVNLLPEVVSPALQNSIIEALVQIADQFGYEVLRPFDSDKLLSCTIKGLEDKNPEVQEAALKSLRHIGSSDATIPLLTYALDVEETDEERMGLIREALKKTEGGKKLQSFVENYEKMVFLAIQALGDIGEESTIPTLFSAFGMASSAIRKAIIGALGNFQTERSLEVLTEALEDEDSSIRREAISSLSRLGSPEAVEPLFFLVDKEPFKDIKECAIDTLCKLYKKGTKKEETLNGFIQRLRASDPYIRELCVRAIGKTHYKEGLKHIESALNDEEWIVRNAAVHALGELPVDSEIISLLQKALSDHNENVRISAIQIVSGSGREEATDILISCLADQDIWVKFQAAETLGIRKEKKAIPSLTLLLQSEDGPHKIAAVKSLGEIGDRSALEKIKPLLSSEDFEIADTAREAIEKLGGS